MTHDNIPFERSVASAVRRHRPRDARAILGIASLACGALSCAPNVNDQADLVLTVYATQDAVNELRNQASDTQTQLDSLRVLIDHQDSIIRVLANTMGNPLPVKPIIPPQP